MSFRPTWSPPTAALLCALLLTAFPLRSDADGLSVSPATLEVGMFSANAGVQIAGRVRAGSDVVVVVRGSDVREVFTRKSRFGPIWIAGGKVVVSGAPALFLSFSRRPVDAILARGTIDRFGLDDRSMTSRMSVTPPGADTRDAFLVLKQEEGSYRSVTGGVTFEATVGGEAPFTVQLEWPPTAPPGSYRAFAFECRDGAVVGTSTASFEVVESGVAAGLKHLAEGHGGVYGALAVGITLSVGFGLDFALAWVRRRRNASRRKRGEALVREDVGVH